MDFYEGLNPRDLLSTFKRSFGTLSPGLKAHLQSVYTCVTLGLLAATVGVSSYIYFELAQKLQWLSVIGMLISFITLKATPCTSSSAQKKRIGYFLAMCFFTGVNIGKLVKIISILNPQIVVMAFLSTCLVFLCFTLAAILNKTGSYLYLGSIAGSLLSVIIIMQISNIFFGSYIIWKLNHFLSLAMVLMYILYDTQLIIFRYNRFQDKDYVMHACLPFFDLVILFKHLLILLAEKNNKKE